MAVSESTRQALGAVVDCMAEAVQLVDAFMSLDQEMRNPPPVLRVFYLHVWRLQERVDLLDTLVHQSVLPLLDDFSKVQGGRK